MKSFEDWYRETRDITAKASWEAGQQSKQAEIDAIKQEILRIVESYLSGSDTDDMGDEIRELLK